MSVCARVSVCVRACKINESSDSLGFHCVCLRVCARACVCTYKPSTRIDVDDQAGRPTETLKETQTYLLLSCASAGGDVGEGDRWDAL